ncbi:MAG: sigma-70 family RNA polymerase sigma factor [Deltaproteobacteria bacterium]|nr:sigma-70 family RNA polymerase sigma factor [Deltaproteobacteria bacterium]
MGKEMMTPAVRRALGLSKPRKKVGAIDVEEFLPTVKAMAFSLAKTVKMPVDDLFGYGCLGLADALKRYEKARGVPFKTYMRHRVLGAMWDGAREWGWFSRKDHARFHMGPLEDLASESSFDPTIDLFRRLEVGLLKDRARAWPERDREILSLYLQGCQQVEIAGLMGVTASRVSQIMKGVEQRAGA